MLLIIVYIFIAFTIPSLVWIAWYYIDRNINIKRGRNLLKTFHWHYTMGLRETMLIKTGIKIDY